MYQILRSAHSGWRYVVLVLVLVALFQALAGWFGNKTYTEGNRKLNVFALISAHIQFVLGLLLYIINAWYQADSSSPVGRYWKMEHIGMMIFAVILITVGNARSKKLDNGQAKHRTIAIYFGMAIVVILAAIYTMTINDPSRSFFGVS